MRLDCERRLHKDGNAWCQSCGAVPERHVSIFDGGTYWCLGCAHMDGMITKDEYQECELDSLKLRKLYLTNALINIETQLATGDS